MLTAARLILVLRPQILPHHLIVGYAKRPSTGLGRCVLAIASVTLVPGVGRGHLPCSDASCCACCQPKAGGQGTAQKQCLAAKPTASKTISK